MSTKWKGMLRCSAQNVKFSFRISSVNMTKSPRICTNEMICINWHPNCLGDALIQKQNSVITYYYWSTIIFISWISSIIIENKFFIQVCLPSEIGCLDGVHKKWSFPLRIYSVNMTKSLEICGLGHIYWRSPPWKTLFSAQCMCWRDTLLSTLLTPLICCTVCLTVFKIQAHHALWNITNIYSTT